MKTIRILSLLAATALPLCAQDYSEIVELDKLEVSADKESNFSLLLPALLATGLSITHTPYMMQVGLTPVLLIFTALPILAWNEWRFAPDFGQTGFMWALTGGVRGTLWAGLGLAIAMIMRAVFNLDPGMTTATIYAGCAGLGRGCGALLMPLSYSMHHAANLTLVAESHSATHTEDNSADWWKDR